MGSIGMTRHLGLLPWREFRVEVFEDLCGFGLKSGNLLPDGPCALAGLHGAQLVNFGFDLGNRLFKIKIAAHRTLSASVRNAADCLRSQVFRTKLSSGLECRSANTPVLYPAASLSPPQCRPRRPGLHSSIVPNHDHTAQKADWDPAPAPRHSRKPPHRTGSSSRKQRHGYGALRGCWALAAEPRCNRPTPA